MNGTVSEGALDFDWKMSVQEWPQNGTQLPSSDQSLPSNGMLPMTVQSMPQNIMQMLTVEVKFQAQGKDYTVSAGHAGESAGRVHDERRPCDNAMKIELNNTSAFTLIEMILAIGIAAIVLVSVNTVLFASLRLRDDTSNMVDAASPVEQTVAFLRHDLLCMVVPTNCSGGVLSGDFKVGNVSSPGITDPVAIEMFTAAGALSDNAPWGDIQRVTYELKMPNDRSALGRNLVRSVVRNLLTRTTPRTWRTSSC